MSLDSVFLRVIALIFSSSWSDLSLDNDFKKGLCWCGGGFGGASSAE